MYFGYVIIHAFLDFGTPMRRGVLFYQKPEVNER